MQAELNSTTLNDANDCLNKGKKRQNDSNLIRHVQLDQKTTRPLPPTRRGDKTVQCNIATSSRIHSNHPMLRSRSRSLHEPHQKPLLTRTLFLKTRTDGFGNTLSNISLDSLHASRRFYNHVLFSSQTCSILGLCVAMASC